MGLWSEWIAPLYQITSRKFRTIILLQFNNEIEVHEIKTFFPTLRSSYRLNSGRREGEEGWAELMFDKEPLQRCKYIYI